METTREEAAAQARLGVEAFPAASPADKASGVGTAAALKVSQAGAATQRDKIIPTVAEPIVDGLTPEAATRASKVFRAAVAAIAHRCTPVGAATMVVAATTAADEAPTAADEATTPPVTMDADITVAAVLASV